MNSFTFARTPRILFGSGTIARCPALLNEIGKGILLVRGRSSLDTTVSRFVESCLDLGMQVFQQSVESEPSPEMVDRAVEAIRDKQIGSVCALGGGSVIDAGKAISAMLPQQDSVIDYLEGVGTKQHDGRKIPFIAVPTTAGTGSEATKNAVLSAVGPQGFKRSLRHENFVPDVAVVDPDLTTSCPESVTAACGMDAFTQLLESYVSPASSPVTDALAYSGLQNIASGLIPSIKNPTDIGARSSMSYAALLSGITLANAGLGVVHSFASSIGGLFPIPHGVVCGTLLGAATSVNIAALRRQDGEHPALRKYACVGALLSNNDTVNTRDGCDELIRVIDSWTTQLSIPRLGSVGITEKDIDTIVGKTILRTNPVTLDNKQLSQIIQQRL